MIKVFDASYLRAFISSNLRARDASEPSVNAIWRIASYRDWVNNDIFINGKEKITPFPHADPRLYSGIDGYHLTPQNTSIIPPHVGWMRHTFLLWGVMPLCNPFAYPRVFSYVVPQGTGLPAITKYAHDDHVEIFIHGGLSNLLEFRESVPPTFIGLTNRIPLNCITRENAVFESPRENATYHIIRTISFSTLTTTEYRPDPFNRLFHQLPVNQVYRYEILLGNPPIRFDDISEIPPDTTLIDPINPVLYQRRSINLYYNMPKFGFAACVASLSNNPDTDYRPVEYTDLVKTRLN